MGRCVLHSAKAVGPRWPFTLRGLSLVLSQVGDLREQGQRLYFFVFIEEKGIFSSGKDSSVHGPAEDETMSLQVAHR